MSLRERVRFWFDDLSTPMGKAVDLIVMVLILLGCGVLVLETYDFGPRWNRIILDVEWTIIALFVIEYLLRLWAVENRLRHAFEFYSLIDLLAIVPAFLIATPHLQILRILRVLRVMRLLRFLTDRHFFFGSIRQSHLDILRIAATILMIIFIYSGFIWHFESEGGNTGIRTFGDAFYFGVVTLTTVGFGDIAPTTDAGRWITVLMIFAGIIFIPWEVRNLIAHATRGTDETTPDCPRCGLRRHDPRALYCRRCGAKLTAQTPPLRA